MDQIVIGKLRDTTSPANGDCNNAGGNNDPLQTTCLQRTLIDYKTGSILSGGTDNPAGQHRARTGPSSTTPIQHYAIEHSRLHIPVDLRRRRGARLRPPVPGDAVPAVDRDGRDLGHRSSPRPPARSRGNAAAAPPAGTGTSPRSRTSPATTAGAATTRRGPRSPRSRRRWAPRTSAACRAAAATRRRSPRRSSTSPATRSRSTATTGSRRSCRSATCRTSSCRRTRAAIDAGASTR